MSLTHKKKIIISVASLLLIIGLIVTVVWATGGFENVSTLSNDEPGDNQESLWKNVHDWNFSTTSELQFLENFKFNNKDYNGGNAVYVSDNSKRLVKVDRNQLVIAPGSLLDNGCVGIGKCIESVKLVSNFTMSPNRIIAFKASQIPGDWENPGVTPSWPAFWLSPATGTWGVNAGEIDIYESVNGANEGVHTTQHTPPNCTMDGSIPGKSVLKESDCNNGPGPTQPYNGCGINHQDVQSARKGTFVCVWELFDTNGNEGVLDFFWWPYDSDLPTKKGGIWSDGPDVSSWEGNKYGSFKISPSTCSSDHFSSFRLIINTNFCGEWSGGVFDGGQDACGKAIAMADTSKLEWRFDRIRILSKNGDIDVPLWKS